MQEKEVYEKFIKGSIVIAITLGGALGVLMLAPLTIGPSLGLSWSLVRAHAHFQLFGWLGLFIMGIAYHVIPRFKATQLHSKFLANLSFWLVMAGVLLRGAAIAVPGVTATVLLALSGFLEFTGVGLFIYVIIKTILSSEQKLEFFERYVGIALLWFLLGSALNWGIGIRMIQGGLHTVPPPLNEALIHTMLFGFATMMIMGIGIRTLPVFLGLQEARKKPVGYALILLNLGVLLRVFSLILLSPSPLLTALLQGGVILEFSAVVIFVYGLNIFTKPEIELPPMEASTNYERSVKGAYLWLLFAVTLGLYITLSDVNVDIFLRDAYIHAVTVGFITMMMFGYATRILPIFKGVDLHSLRLADAALFLLVGGNLIRVTLELFYPFIGPLKALLGLSGVITLAAYAAFGYNIWATINKPYGEE
jgi:hypothetical protein